MSSDTGPTPYNPLLTTLDIGGHGRRDSKTGARLSIALHIGLAIFVTLKALVYPGNSVPYVPTLRVDMVDLPDALKQELRSAKPTQSLSDINQVLKKAEIDAKKTKAIEPPAEPDELVLKPKEAKPEKTADKSVARDKKLKSALDRIRSLEKLEAAEQRDAKPVVLKGNAISKGTSLSGEAREAAEASYYDLVQDKLHENWELPVWLARQNLSAKVLILLDASGRLRGIRFLKSSGNAQFDEAVKKTVTASDPFPRPPAELASVVENGIPAGFPL